MSRILSWSRVGGMVVSLVLLLTSVVFGQDAPVGGETETDYRSRVLLAYGLVMGAVIFYLVLSHFRNARLADEIEFLGRRVAELKKGEESGTG